MKKTFKNEEIVRILSRFQKLENSDTEILKLPASIAWKRRLNKKAFLDVSEEIDKALKEIQEVYRDDTYSVQDLDDPDRRNIKPEYQAEFGKKQMEILNQNTEVEIRTVKLSELPEELTDLQLDTLDFMVEED